MADHISRIAPRLSDAAINDLFHRSNIALIDLEGLGPRKRTRKFVEAILNATDRARARCEGITGHVWALANKEEYAESALRSVCEGRTQLIDLLDKKRSLEERILNLWYLEPYVVDRARNIAMAYRWRDGRSHSRFDVENPDALADNLDQAVEAIRSKVQTLQGGRRVMCDHFQCYDRHEPDGDGSRADLIHHIAIYLEAPARFLMEFDDADHIVIPTLRREARELSISYNFGKKAVFVAGKGVGGAQVFRQIAELFCKKGLSGATMTEVIREEWPLHLFQEMEGPPLSPPPGFSRVRVSEASFSPGAQVGGKVVVRSRPVHTVYERMGEIGITENTLKNELIRSVTLSFEALPERDHCESREVRASLNWPNTIHFDGATLSDQRSIEAWLQRPPFKTS